MVEEITKLAMGKTRTEDQMLSMIIGFAQADERIRAAVMNGSRVSPDVARDVFQDYDVVNFVTDVEPFRDASYVTPRFGKAILIQEPESKECPAPVGDGSYNYNIQLADGNRIDLSFVSIEAVHDVALSARGRQWHTRGGLFETESRVSWSSASWNRPRPRPRVRVSPGVSASGC